MSITGCAAAVEKDTGKNDKAWNLFVESFSLHFFVIEQAVPGVRTLRGISVRLLLPASGSSKSSRFRRKIHNVRKRKASCKMVLSVFVFMKIRKIFQYLSSRALRV